MAKEKPEEKLDEKAIRQLIAHGTSGFSLAKILGKSPPATYSLLKKLGIKTFQQKKAALLKEQPSLIITSYKEGSSINEICRDLGMNYRTVRKLLVENNVSIRKRIKRKKCDCGKPIEDYIEGGKFCKKCQIRKQNNGVCPDCDTPLYRGIKKTKIGNIQARICRKCCTRYEYIETVIEY